MKLDYNEKNLRLQVERFKDYILKFIPDNKSRAVALNDLDNLHDTLRIAAGVDNDER